MRAPLLVAGGATALLTAACASRPAASPANAPQSTAPSATPSATPSAAVAATGGAAGAATPLRWAGTLQPTQQRTGGVAPTQRQKATGTVTLSPTRDGSATEARITISVPVQQPMMLRWAVLPGRCGSGTLPLLSVEQFPTIEVGTNGRGEMRGTAPMALPSSGTYHVNVYWQGQQLTDVMTCANLRLDGGMP